MIGACTRVPRALRVPLAGSVVLLGLMAAARSAPWPPDGRAIAEHGIPPHVPSCVSCHGSSLSGHRATGAPDLRGQTADDLMDALYTMAQHLSDHSAMAKLARHLNMAQRSAVTAYLASLPAKPK